ncbi:MAG TPA: AbrB/MazE/SpoVT family DNA-binding domain-containing protein [Bryobacteraceae bacterium]|nr:AbrB/MazE/SpoVT family DNA-binding domain-containing protein [Bryobacteraceae bacterium]
MTAKLILDSAGRIVIPKSLRDELHLAAGDALQIESEGERIVLRPVPTSMPLCKEGGIWVLRTGEPLRARVTDQVIEDVRSERDRANAGVTGGR